MEILENYINNKTDKVELYSGFSKHLYEPYPISVDRIQPEKYVGQLTTASPLEEDELGDLRWSFSPFNPLPIILIMPPPHLYLIRTHFFSKKVSLYKTKHPYLLMPFRILDTNTCCRSPSLLNTKNKKMNWVLVTTSNFLTTISLQPDGANFWYFKLRFFDRPEFIVWNI